MHQLKLRSHLQRCKMCVFKIKTKNTKTKAKKTQNHSIPLNCCFDVSDRGEGWPMTQAARENPPDIHLRLSLTYMYSGRGEGGHDTCTAACAENTVCECITGKGSVNDPSAFMEEPGLTVKEFLEAYQLKFKSGYFWNSKWCKWLSKSFWNGTVWDKLPDSLSKE